jgi:hypothetical protein
MIPEDSLTISVFQDGNAFCAVFTDTFENIQESDCGFGWSRSAAILQLLESNNL